MQIMLWCKSIARPLSLTAALVALAVLRVNAAAASRSNKPIKEPAAMSKVTSASVPQAYPKAIHPQNRESASPSGGAAVAVNPPALLWPPAESKTAKYAVRLSQDRSFPAGATIHSEGQPWAFSNPHTKLAEGQWRWQYGVMDGKGEAKWSALYEFRVDRTARVFETSPALALIGALGHGHPRVYTTPAMLAALRAKYPKDSPTTKRFAEDGEAAMEKPIRDEGAAKPKEKGANQQQEKDFAKWASKQFAGHLKGPVTDLVTAYWITGDERYGREAAKRALLVARMDPDGDTSPRVSDFADGSCMKLMALAYDGCFTLLTDDQKKQLREAMAYRARRFYKARVNRLEASVWSAHVWQHILMDFSEIAFAAVGEIPEAEEWASYAYGIWVARFPLMGGDDGGWDEGVNYFKTSHESLLTMPLRFQRLTGRDFMDQPWYRNAAAFELYAWPPRSASNGFGDGSERGIAPPGDMARFFMGTLARKFADPYAAWYARETSKGSSADLGMSSLHAFKVLTWDAPQLGPAPQPKAPTDLPLARAFRDVGVVSMHTDLASADVDVAIGFRSSPYGGRGHSHADQNSFNIMVGGQRLFANSGYYTAAGDEHCNQWYRQTRATNSVLIDGKGGLYSPEGYGWIARFLHAGPVSYCLGDASRAYGDAGLTRFRRHLAFLRPATIVIYDELEADHAAQWSWLLHSDGKITAEASDDGKDGHLALTAGVSKSRGRADVWGSGALKTEINDVFDPPAENWRGKKRPDGSLEYPNQWHAAVQPSGKAPRARFLAVIQAQSTSGTAALAAPQTQGDGSVVVGDWVIRGELDADKPASLVIVRADGQMALACDQTDVMLNGKKEACEGPGASVLMEAGGGKVNKTVSRDEAPQLY